MLTILTQEAIRVLRYIYYRDAGISCPPDSSDCVFRNVSVLLPLLERIAPEQFTVTHYAALTELTKK